MKQVEFKVFLLNLLAIYVQVFPLMLHKNTAEKFSFDDCKRTTFYLQKKVSLASPNFLLLIKKKSGRFRIQRQKESTGRVVFWSMGIVCSYTMEVRGFFLFLGGRGLTYCLEILECFLIGLLRRHQHGPEGVHPLQHRGL